jgi:chorismate synthase
MPPERRSGRIACMVRWLTAGESHGPALVTIAEGLPAGIEVSSESVGVDLARRRLGAGRGARMKFERDEVRFLGGVRHGRTLGGPVAIEVGNTEWPKWEQVMSPDPVDDEVIAELARNAPLTRPRPGHADLVGMQKYGFTDARPILERASARETAARVAIASVARAFLRQVAGIEVVSHVVRIGAAATSAESRLPVASDQAAIDDSPVRCLDAVAAAAMEEEIASAHRDGDTLGGVVEVLAYGLPPGLGSHVHWDRRLDARLAAALMGIQAIKGVEVGDGFGLAAVRGSQAQDEIIDDEGRLVRTSGKSGGTEGGMSTGEALRVRAAMKPISTIPKALRTVDVATREAAPAINQRSDVCAVPAAGIVAEAMVLMVLAEAILEKFGGDSVDEVARNIRGYLDHLSVQ